MKIKTMKKMLKTKYKKKKIGVYGISGCAGCLLSIFFEEEFKEILNLVDIKSFPLIKRENYSRKLDYVFIEGTVCFDEDIETIKKLRKRANKIIALGSCACFGGVPSMKNFLNKEKIVHFVYPKFNHLKLTDPTPLDKHIKVDYYLPQCPPSKKEVLEFIKCIVTEKNFKQNLSSVCFECRKKGNLCLLERGEICLGPITNSGCDALCPSNNVKCYGCRGYCKDSNIFAYTKLLEEKGYNKKEFQEKISTFAGLQFFEQKEKISKWLED